MPFKTLAELLEMVAGLERDLGLSGYTALERDVLVVIGVLSEHGLDVRTEAIAAHPLVAGVPRSSLHRALRALLDRGVIRHPDGTKAGRYLLVRA
jgi:DNA-binding IclR family transcriptional regulator